MKIFAEAVAAACIGLAVYFAVLGNAGAAGGWTFSGVAWFCLWSER